MSKFLSYRVGPHQFTNKFQAFKEHVKTGLPMRFDVYESAYDQADWSVDPALSWDQLLDLRAQQIAAKKRPIILGFSAGSDSLTIYEVFKRNKIPLTAVHIRTKNNPEEQCFYDEPLEFIHREQKEMGFRLINSKEDIRSTTEVYDSPNWWQRDGNRHCWFAVGVEGLDLERSYFLQESGIDPNYIYITGHEKPRLKVIDNKFYSYLSDESFNNYFEVRLDHFYVTPDMPELHIKQSYLLANYMLFLAKKHKKPVGMFEEIWDEKKFFHSRYSIEGCGRFGDMGNSPLQKAMNRGMKIVIPDKDISRTIYKGRSWKMLDEGIKSGRSFAKNFLQGLMDMKSDPILSQAFAPGDDYRVRVPVESKLYELGIPATVDFSS